MGQPLGTSLLFGVFDGHGTDQVSSFLENNTLSYLQRSFNGTSTEDIHAEQEIHKHLTSAFQALHDDVCKEDADNSIGGSTACIVIVGREKIICSNAGDSRAVLVRSDGSVKHMSDDHKPDREDEKKRIQDAGGCIYYNCSEFRVAGVLAMSRAIGDGWLHKYGVSCQPDTIFHQRSSMDDYVILASDGVWAAFSNEEAALLVKAVLSKLKERGIDRKKSFSVAAKCLVKAALNRGSMDNTSAVLIDVKKPSPLPLPAAAPKEISPAQQLHQPSITITTSGGHSSKQNIDPILANLRPIITTKGADFSPSSNQSALMRTRSTDPRLPFSSLSMSSVLLPALIAPLRTAISDSLPIDLVA